jgi:hypothetical protein
MVRPEGSVRLYQCSKPVIGKRENLQIGQIPIKPDVGQRPLADVEINQRGKSAMCSHLKDYLKETFAPLDVDFEYDSFGDKAKRSPIASRKKKQASSRPLSNA